MYNIVPLNIKHIAQIAEIEKQSFETPWSYNQLEHELKNELAHYFVVENGEEVLAYCGYYRILEEAHITNIAVKERYRHQGVGSALFGYIIDFAKNSGIERMTLEVSEANPNAIKMYENFGFKLFGRRIKYYENTHDALIFWLTL